MNRRERPAGCCRIPQPSIAIPSSQRTALTGYFKALADPNRLEMFLLIAAQDEPLCACDVVDRFPLTQPTISHHLKVLAEAGLIEVSRQGVWAYYQVSSEGERMLAGLLEHAPGAGVHSR